MRPHPIVTCSKPLASNASAAPLDVGKIKSALGALGLYEAPAWGVSQFPDAALFDAIRAFQKAQGLKVDGAIKPGGETEAALSQAMNPRRSKAALQATAQALQSLGRGG
ncbi:peptidoglycan-binding domain-containing protein, partial [Magnetovibrio sp.]|uniref:peptidoglycan-binding domain-containing protein n=1 Tax=Magnetovibrio sp. TaxID=2024836 RepID=UPI002F93389A